MTGLRDDLRQALRVFWNAPSFAAAAVLTLALGLGVNIAVFSVMHAALIARLPVKNASELLSVYSWAPQKSDHSDFSYPLYVDLRDRTDGLDGLAAYTSLGLGVSSGPVTERFIGELVTSNYFHVLGVDIAPGPGFAGADERLGAPPAVVISPRVWQSMFDSNPAAIGRTLQVNGLAATVVGVAPASFSGFTRGQRVDLWLTVNQYFALQHGSNERFSSYGTSWLSIVGRLKPGASAARAEAQMTTMMRVAAEGHDDEWSIRTRAAGSGDTSLVDDLGRPLRLLALVVGLILVIASANVANLLLMRGYTRQQEIAMRTALGASRWRLVRQLLVESAVLSFAGGAAGLLLGVWTAAFFDIRTATGGALSLRVEPDAAVVAYAVGASAIAALAIGLLPAFGGSRADLVTVLKGTGPAGRGKGRVRMGLTVVQMAVSLVLVVGAGLFLRSLSKLHAIDPSLVTDRVVAAQLNLTLRGYDAAAGTQFYARALEAVRAVRGVQTATFASVLPVSAGAMRMNLNAGATTPKVDAPVEFDIVLIASGYFDTFGVPLVRGRDFTAADAAGAPAVTIVNESMRRRLWGDADPVGDTFRGGSPQPYTVVGVARDTKYRNLRERARLVMYLPLAQSYASSANLVVRTTLPPSQIVEGMRAAVRGVDAGLPLYNVRTLAEHVDRSLYVDRLRATLVGVLAALALALAAIGVYAVLSYSIAERTREVGVRLALGAQPRTVLRMLLGAGARVALVGITAGLALSMASARFISAQLYGLSAFDPATLVAAPAVLFAVALAAAFIPAWRATRIDPAVALRHQ